MAFEADPHTRTTPMKTRATYEDLLAAPDHKIAEIVDGELVVSPRPTSAHARTCSVLGMEIGGAFDRGRGGPGGWLLLFEPELHFGEDVLVPDLAAWRRERMPVLPNAPFLTLSPDWVCEVASPSTEHLDRRRKRPIYAREGVGHLWIVSPSTHALEVHRRSPEGWLVVATHGADERVRAEPFEAIELDLTALWADTAG
jgi:Uma2 family endonuclease